MSPKLSEKRVIITGAGSGIGRASAVRFAHEGAKVLVVGRTEEKIAETVTLIRNSGGIAVAMAADAAVEANIEAMITCCIAEFGGLDCFFCNAATWIGNVQIFEQTVEQWSEVLRVNLVGAFLSVKYAGRHMKQHGSGSIIITSSIASLRANAGDAAYSASKAGINSLVQVAANELTGSGVRINAILPGLVQTPGTQSIFDAAKARGAEAKIGRINPLQRAGQPEEIAAMVAFLASEDASYITGQCYSVDGGVSSSHPFGRLG